MQSERRKVRLTTNDAPTVLDGRYQLMSQIGEGGMGAVYLAQQLSTQKEVAVKVISAASIEDKALLRFKKEAAFLSSFSHPNIVSLLDYGVDAGQCPFLVMDYVQGESLSQRLKRGPRLTEKEQTSTFLQIAKALAYLHAKKIV